MAALLVMAYHFLRFGPGTPQQFAAGEVLHRLLPLMDMFFMISGFLILLRYGDRLKDTAGYRRFIVRRLARFYPLYLVTSVFFVVVAIALHLGMVESTQAERYDYNLLWQNLLLVQAWGTTENLSFNYVAWSLSAEWFCYLLLPVYVLVIRRGGLVGLATLAVLSVIALEVATAAGIIPFDSWLQADTWGAYRAFADFAVGGVVMMCARDSRWQLRSHLPAWGVFAISIVGMLLLWPSYVTVFLLALSMFFAALAERNNPADAEWLSVFSPAGRASFGIYLIHPMVETILLAIVWQHFLAPLEVMSFYVFWIVPMVATIFLAMASDRYFEKPVSERLNRLFGEPEAAGKVQRRNAPA
ncbi:peptidoglycan/LPS O-acetylase OafA/YrhL [Pararhizobium capsulatum DSM 1112]|uniref:Peptidoglycan/LPS O-acetylase OafA/YrhL n=2 Tax=Pararhizobium capsulatum TaxID=34014 RepID=A0ABU0BKY0_9HYPH|nr:acyltransferase [Pararhizobium capsulatum]MDQ0318336.1 peptidoglycan/LPS O-acetylase OafA/YrhL [Pararhizobium capsulatum DSM 1112]